MYIDNKTIRSNHDWYRVGLLLKKAVDLGIDIKGLNSIGLDEVTKEVRFYLDDYDFKLLVAENSNTVQACTSSSTSRQEYYLSLKNKTLEDIDRWSKKNKGNKK